jgi:hypothetical protein
MADFDVVAATSETLQAVLTKALSTLTPPPVAEVHDLQGAISTNPARLTIFLFEAGEDPSARNRPRVRGVSPPDLTVRKPSMAILLRYLLTPWSGDRLTDHKIIGRVMQVLYDGAILSGADLKGNLAGTSDALKVTMTPLALEDRTRVWHAVQKPYRLSICYEIRVVNLDPESEERLHPVSRRSIDYAVGERTL